MVLKQPKKASPASAKTTGKRLIDNLKYGYILFKDLPMELNAQAYTKYTYMTNIAAKCF